MNLFVRNDRGHYQSAEAEQIINYAQQIICDRLQRNVDVVATSPQDVQEFLQLKLAGRKYRGCAEKDRVLTRGDLPA